MVVSRVVAIVILSLALLSCAATMPGCDEHAPATEGDMTYEVTVGGKSFKLELSLDDQHRFRGLSGRESIDPAGGMLFVFPESGVQQQSFVMRDCAVDIDIIYLDRSGRIVAMHEMKAEAPRSEAEKQPDSRPGIPDWAATNSAYENRLKRYPSKYPSQFVIELKGGTIKDLNIKKGDQIKLDMKGLKKRAK
jgi:uncharacterized membrane protein (UPF0127 family)